MNAISVECDNDDDDDDGGGGGDASEMNVQAVAESVSNKSIVDIIVIGGVVCITSRVSGVQLGRRKQLGQLKTE
jgi:hypothetical protein